MLKLAPRGIGEKHTYRKQGDKDNKDREKDMTRRARCFSAKSTMEAAGASSAGAGSATIGAWSSSDTLRQFLMNVCIESRLLILN